jgi:hypothetical protein
MPFYSPHVLGLIVTFIIQRFEREESLTNCITGNVTLRRNVASGEMLPSDRQESLSEEQHDEPEKQA